jgi:hypothetical protein
MAHEICKGDDGIIRISFIGDLTKEGWEAYLKEIEPLEKTSRESGNPFLLMVNTSRAGKVSSVARRGMAAMGGRSEPVRVAVVGMSRYVRVLVGFLKKARGQGYVHMFDSEEKAAAWLKEEAEL